MSLVAAPLGRVVIEGGRPLEGTVRVSGAKNSVLKLMVASLLAEGRHTLENVPDISDVATMSEVLEGLGATVTRPRRHTLVIEVPAQLATEVPWELAERMRATVVLLGPLLARFGEARVPLPGGDDFGGRPIDFHVRGLTSMGASVEQAHGYVTASAPGRLVGAELTLEFASHTATDNLLMAAVLAKGKTVIENAAREPEVVDLAGFLRRMGAHVRGAGTARIEVEGVERLHGASHAVVADRVESATFLAATGIAGGEVLVQGCRPEHMATLLQKQREMGMTLTPVEDGILALAPRRLQAIDISTLPYPGVATDYKPVLVAMLSVAEGVGIVTENLFFGGRWRYVEELCRMGADIRTEGHHAVVRGIPRLSGYHVRASDIRAGAALVLAGLAADGQTVVSGASHIARGYEDLAGKLAGIGARVAAWPLPDDEPA